MLAARGWVASWNLGAERLTGYAPGEILGRDYIVKPVDIDQFFDAIQRLGLYWAVLNRPERHPRAARL